MLYMLNDLNMHECYLIEHVEISLILLYCIQFLEMHLQIKVFTVTFATIAIVTFDLCWMMPPTPARRFNYLDQRIIIM